MFKLTATILVFLMAGIPVMHRAILDNRIDHIKKLEELRMERFHERI